MENKLNKNGLYDVRIWHGTRSMIIIKAELIEVELYDHSSEKLVFIVQDTFGNQFKISDCWLKHNSGDNVVKGLWFNYKLKNDRSFIFNDSAIAMTLSHYNCESIGEIIGKEVEVFPNEKNFFALVSCNMN